ncbi:hypothetical protein HK101_008719 [Irineochytrium annulatum]|nr:hypothetical protein HK101_008719 [Irineochytrium annulatum]
MSENDLSGEEEWDGYDDPAMGGDSAEEDENESVLDGKRARSNDDEDDADDGSDCVSTRNPKKRKVAKAAKGAKDSRVDDVLMGEGESSNLFRMQTEELLRSVKVDARTSERIDGILHELKDIVEEMEEVPELELSAAVKKAKMMGVAIPFPNPAPPKDWKHTFQFAKPRKIFVAGSYLLKTVTKARKTINIDIAVEMPEDLFLEKDHLNYRYFYKRSYFLAIFAGMLKEKLGDRYSLSFSACDNDRRRVILLLEPSDDGDKGGYIIRVFPTIAQNVFASRRLAPGRNSVRPISDTPNTKDSADLPSTPHYNTALLMDTSLLSSLNFLAHHSSTCGGFTTACILGRVWVSQKGLYDKFNGFLFSLVLGYLLNGQGSMRVSKSFPPEKLFTHTLKFLASPEFVRTPIFLTPNGKALDQPEVLLYYYGTSDVWKFSRDAFASHFEAVIVDSTGTINFGSNLTKVDLQHVHYEAKSTVAMLEDKVNDNFALIFLTKLSNPHMYYDVVLRVTSEPGNFPAYKEVVKLDYPDRNRFAHQFILRLISKGLQSRMKLLTADSEPTQSWSISTRNTADSVFPALRIGMILEPETGLKPLEVGPDLENVAAVSDFRRLWGRKSESRRFQDGTICEAVVWETSGNAEDNATVTGKMAAFLISRHVGIAENEGVKIWGCSLAGFLKPLGAPKDLTRGTFQNVVDAFNVFAKQLKALDSLPLSIISVLPAHPALRYTSVFVPQPRALDSNRSSGMLMLEDYLEVVLELESSVRWPDNVAAIEQMKLAYYVRIAEEFKTAHPGSACAVSYGIVKAVRCGHLDVAVPSGYRFRVRIHFDGDTTVKNGAPSDGSVDIAAHVEFLEERLVRRPSHSTRMQNACLKYPLLSFVIRLVKRFLSSHLLLRFFADEAIELIVLKLFTSPLPYPSPPCSAWTGFLRALEVLSRWNWVEEFLAVEYEPNQITAEVMTSIKWKFNARRGAKKTDDRKSFPMCIATASDLDGSWWTSKNPSKFVLRRAKAVCKAALSFLEEEMLKGTDPQISKLFVSPTTGYDAVIRLEPAKLPTFYQNISFDGAMLGAKRGRFKNLSAMSRDESSLALELFDPVDFYLMELQSAVVPNYKAMFAEMERLGLGLVAAVNLARDESF